MVLLCNDNPINIKNVHILKCLNKKRDNFKVKVVPLEESLKEENIFINQNLNINYDDKEMKTIIKNLQKIEK
jgi:hypothetical protein